MPIVVAKDDSGQVVGVVLSKTVLAGAELLIEKGIEFTGYSVYGEYMTDTILLYPATLHTKTYEGGQEEQVYANICRKGL